MSKQRQQKGQTIVFMALAIVVFLGFTGLAIDGGMLLTSRRRAQVIADSAALAAAHARAQNKTQSEATAIANNIAEQNGLNPDNDTLTATYEQRSDSEYIHIKITTTAKTLFMQALMPSALKTTVEAVARVKVNRTPLYNGRALVALDPHSDNAFWLGGASIVDVRNSGIFVNSDAERSSGWFGGCHGGALQIDGGVIVHTDTGIDVVGDYILNGAAIIEEGDDEWSGSMGMCGFTFGAPPIHTGAEPDPDVANGNPPSWVQYIPPMPAPSCNNLPKRETSSITAVGPVTLEPGNYINGLSISGAGTITMQDGVYCFSGGDLQINGAHLVTGHDVKWVAQGNNNIKILGGSSLKFDNLEIYTEDGDFTTAGASHVDAARYRFSSSGDGDFTVLGGSWFESDNASLYLAEGVPSWYGAQGFVVHAPPPNDPYGGLFIYMPWTNTSELNFYGATYLDMTGSILAPHADITIMGAAVIEGVDTQIVGYTFHTLGASHLGIDFHESNQFGIPHVVVELVK